MAPLDPAGQLGQWNRPSGFPQHVEDPSRQGIFQGLGDPSRPSMVNHVAFEGFPDLEAIHDLSLADDVVEDPDEQVGDEYVIDVFCEFAR